MGGHWPSIGIATFTLFAMVNVRDSEPRTQLATSTGLAATENHVSEDTMSESGKTSKGWGKAQYVQYAQYAQYAQ